MCIIKGLIDKLQECHHGVMIGKCRYNTFCYADRLEGADQYCNRLCQSVWYSFIDNVELDVKPAITYLGTVLGVLNGNAHCEARSRAAHKSFYAYKVQE